MTGVWRRLAWVGGVLVGCGVAWGVAVQVVRAGGPAGPAAGDDGGRHWQRTLEVPGAEVFDVAMAPSQPATVYAATSRGVYRSSDGGRSWTRVLTGPRSSTDEKPEESSAISSASVAMIAERPGLVLAALGPQLWRSDDDGRTWQALPSLGLGAPTIRSLRVIPGDPDHLYAATASGVFRVPLPMPLGRTPGAIPPVAPEFPDVQAPCADEPTIHQVQAAAVRYAEVMPEKIQGWRTRAAWRAWVPHFTLSVNHDTDTTIGSSSSGGKTTFTVGPDDHRVSLGYGFTWDLANLVWNPEQTSIDTRSRLMVQLRNDILEEVTRVYFERRRLQVEAQFVPVKEPSLQAERRLRIEELTAQLDALTGGYFSAHHS